VNDLSMPALPAGNGPWRVLILDRDPEDPRWIIATVSLPADVRAAELDAAGRYRDWQAVCQWVVSQVGRTVTLVPVHDSLAWRVDEGGLPR
jgi:hypothetical protein